MLKLAEQIEILASEAETAARSGEYEHAKRHADNAERIMLTTDWGDRQALLIADSERQQEFPSYQH